VAQSLAPVPGGDLIRSPEILPTGRNIHAFDPFRMPTAFALLDGAAQAERLIAAHHCLPRPSQWRRRALCPCRSRHYV
jgi:magnesium chelatase subunit H